MFTRWLVRSLLSAAAFAFLTALPARAQTTQPITNTGGVQITPEGVLTVRTTARVARPAVRSKDGAMGYVSLPRLLLAAKEQTVRQQPLTPEVRFLGGLTQIHYIFVYPEEHDLVLAGPTEPLQNVNPLVTVGQQTGRPTVQLDDLIVALRANRDRSAHDTFGCSLDMRPGGLDAAAESLRKLGNASNAVVAAELKRVLGPQTVRVFGVPPDSRMAFGMLAADYRLKRLAMGAETMPVSGVGNGLGAGAASNRVWFTPAYEPLLVSPDGNAYELRGPRLKLEAGAQMFETRGASEEAKAFASRFSAKMPEVAAVVDSIADLQNITDLLVVAALIHQDRLAQRAGVDLSWATEETGYSPVRCPVAVSADTMVHFTSGSVVAGGVTITTRALMVAAARQQDEKGTLTAAAKRPTEDWRLVERAPSAAAE